MGPPSNPAQDILSDATAVHLRREIKEIPLMQSAPIYTAQDPLSGDIMDGAE
ncbi:hypothetical protein [Erythrobacter mangrovi]|uniref:Uncharacterized protein n=1 Tax=Erythrobacter mangrovi TaxID=2739433 RepID=A0A7D4CBN8_9SPHN|nr:hypothetical protein [Erythrobacter mangrovi]QKG70069.1 hypothetical protein HQR01_01040 [Erythrobacter mangrovi]